MSSACNRTYDAEGFCPGGNGIGHRRVGRLVGQILLACEKPDEWPTLLRGLISDCAAQHRVVGLERIKDRALRWLVTDFEFDLAANSGQRSEVRREHDADHGSV